VSDVVDARSLFLKVSPTVNQKEKVSIKSNSKEASVQLLRNVLVDTVVDSVSLVHTGLPKTQPSNISRSSWSIHNIKLSEEILVSTGYARLL